MTGGTEAARRLRAIWNDYGDAFEEALHLARKVEVNGEITQAERTEFSLLSEKLESAAEALREV